MILCVDTQAIKCAYEVQKNVNLQDILAKHTKFYPTVEEALEAKYVPLDFAVTVRTLYSNKVMQIETENGVRYYTNLTQIPQYIHKGYDLIMFLASIGMMHNIDYARDFDEVMTKHSQFDCLGFYNPDPMVLNPIIYSHILISDEGAPEIEKFFKSGRKFVTIKEMNENCVGNIPAILNEIIEVKEKEQCQE